MFVVMAMAAIQIPQVISREPTAATAWTQTFAASCGAQRLVVRQHLRPFGRLAEVNLNRQPVKGDTSRMIESLSEGRAAYRMSIQCSQGNGSLWFRWVRGLADGKGQIGYEVGSANFAKGRIAGVRISKDQSGPDKIEDDSFWYR